MSTVILMNNRSISLLLILLIAVFGIQYDSHADCDENTTNEEFTALFEALPWEDYTHDHDATNMPNPNL
jgi:hypothetical protein